jgi:hypothetical protein|tara:strand:- start:11941 stop:12294 length:354 start_codon:yes stop_codon:yes gene_type:complete
MKSYLIFFKNGEIQEKKTNENVFDISKFKEFNKFKMYQDYIVMYKDGENSELNLTVLSFTTDRYNSDIGLFKIENNQIKSLTMNNYVKQLEKEKYEIHEEDTNVLDILNCYKDIITF